MIGSAPRGRLGAFAVPVLAAVLLLYRFLSDLQIAVTSPASLIVIATTLGLALAGGLVAAFGNSLVRVAVLTVTAVVLLDTTFRLSGVFDRMSPANRILMARDEQRVADIHVIKRALEEHVARFGALPAAAEYGEGVGPAAFWEGWWDLSAHDANQDGRPFLDFLVQSKVLDSVPVDPVNRSTSNTDPRQGSQYVYFVVPAHYGYEGGACEASIGRSTYLIGITDLEYEPARPPATFTGSGCECLWRDKPKYFEQYFDYVLCGDFPVAAASARVSWD